MCLVAQKTKVHGACQLCLKDRQLRHSHIFPELFYKPVYENQRAFIITGNPEKKIKWIQQGIREHLLCQECETQFSKYELSVRAILSCESSINGFRVF